MNYMILDFVFKDSYKSNLQSTSFKVPLEIKFYDCEKVCIKKFKKNLKNAFTTTPYVNLVNN